MQQRLDYRRMAPEAARSMYALVWADEHHARMGQWPKHILGAINGAPGES
jgi:hypothetical protein